MVLLHLGQVGAALVQTPNKVNQLHLCLPGNLYKYYCFYISTDMLLHLVTVHLVTMWWSAILHHSFQIETGCVLGLICDIMKTHSLYF